MIELLDLYTTGYNISQIIFWHIVIFFRLDTPLELFWLPTEVLRYTPCIQLYSFNSLSLSNLLTVPSYISSARTPRKTPSSIIKNACLLVRYLAIDVLLLLRM
jgi:hypothetical protein